MNQTQNFMSFTEGPFQSDALLVPEGCLFDHIHNASRCWPFVRWNQTGATACQERNMQMRSFAMLLPCGISLFSGVEFVCCPKHFKGEQDIGFVFIVITLVWPLQWSGTSINSLRPVVREEQKKVLSHNLFPFSSAWVKRHCENPLWQHFSFIRLTLFNLFSNFSSIKLDKNFALIFSPPLFSSSSPARHLKPTTFQLWLKNRFLK